MTDSIEARIDALERRMDEDYAQEYKILLIVVGLFTALYTAWFLDTYSYQYIETLQLMFILLVTAWAFIVAVGWRYWVLLKRLKEGGA